MMRTEGSIGKREEGFYAYEPIRMDWIRQKAWSDAATPLHPFVFGPAPALGLLPSRALSSDAGKPSVIQPDHIINNQARLHPTAGQENT